MVLPTMRSHRHADIDHSARPAGRQTRFGPGRRPGCRSGRWSGHPPLAADFDLPSLARPQVPLALVTARQDRWLIPAFHSDAVLAVCRTCELLAELPDGGHGALLSPLPPGFTGLAAALLNDPPGFDRRQLPALDQRIAAYFSRHLLR